MKPVSRDFNNGGNGQEVQDGISSQMNSFYGGDNGMLNAGGERVRVAMRVRPMLSFELSRGDENIITTPDI